MKPKAIEELDEAFAVRQHGIIHLNTADRFYWREEKIRPSNFEHFLARYYPKRGFRVGRYAPATGFQELTSNKDNKAKKSNPFSGCDLQDPVEALNKIVSLLRNKKEKWIILVHYGEHLAPSNSVGISASVAPGQVHAIEILHMLSLDDSIKAGDSRAVIITYTELPDDLLSRSSGYRCIQINLPSFDERLDFIIFLLENGTFGELQNGQTPEYLAKITSGMPLIEIEKLFRQAVYHRTPVSTDKVKVAKASAIRQLTGDLLEVSEPEETIEQVAGLRHVKDFFKRLVPQLEDGQKAIPQGILLNGVPGCGKSHVVRALANLLGWVLIEFRNVRGPYVGQSEQNLDFIIKIAEQFDRSIIFFDEIDQLIGQRGTGASGDSGTSERMLARIFSWLGSMKHRGTHLFIGASNRPDLLDIALCDRFRVSLPVLQPSRSDILELMPILLNRFDRRLAKNLPLEKAADILAPLRPTGRCLQEILVNASMRSDDDSGKIGSEIGKEHLANTAMNHLPSEDPIEMSFIGLTALAKCNDQSYLPWMTMKGLREGAEIPQNLITDGLVDEKTGRLDNIKLHERLNELAKTRRFSKDLRS